jgi:hypothetical protein
VPLSHENNNKDRGDKNTGTKETKIYGKKGQKVKKGH